MMSDSTKEPTVLRWETLSKKKFDELDRSQCVVILTCSPLEVHGPHLPLAADALEGEGLLLRTIRQLPEPYRSKTFLQLPFVYAATDTVPQPGSIFFRPSTIIRLLTDLGRSLSAQGFRDIVVSNFHGGPRHFLAIEKACDKVSRERNVRMVCIFSVLLTRLTGGSAELYDALGDIPGVNPDDLIGDTHAGLVETSQLLALHPEWVEKDYAELPRQTVEDWMEEQGLERPETKRGQPASFRDMIRAFRGGLAFFRVESYSGTPAAASPELGDQILDRLSQKAAEAMVEIFENKLPPDEWHSPIWPKRFLFINPVMAWIFDRILGIPKGVY